MKVAQILAATDFSDAGMYALAEAAAWAQRYRSPLHIVHVVPPKRWFGGIFGSPDSVHDVACKRAAAALKSIVDRVDTTHIPHISSGIMEGSAARTIARAVQEHGADLLVIGARGEHQADENQTGLGGTAAKLVHSPNVPVLLVRRAPLATARSVLALVDLTPLSSILVQWALRCSHGGELRVLHVYEVPFSRRLRTYGVSETAINVYAEDEHIKRTEQLSNLIKAASPPSTVRVQQSVERGESEQALFKVIRGFTGSTLVVGKHSSDFERPTSNYDGVCEYAARLCPTNVLIVPPLSADNCQPADD